MALIRHTLEGRVDLVKRSVHRIRSFEPISAGWYNEPYFVAYSGGKDSDALRILFELAGVPFELVHNHTTVDAPETVRYVRSIPGIRINYPAESMWRLIERKGIPPTRTMRYCCSTLKEGGGRDRFVATGVRWAESHNRRTKRSGVEVLGSSTRSKLMLNADNDDSRRIFESCTLKGKRVLNPIIDWTDDEVWELLHHHGVASNPLYREGYSRIGCVGCPQAGPEGMRQEFARWPVYRDNYIRAFDRMVRRHGYDKTSRSWHSGEEVFRWWISRRPAPIQVAGQLSMEEMHEER